MSETKQDTMTRRLKQQERMSQERLDEFRDDLAVDPLYAMKWSQDAIDAAASLRCAQVLLGAMEGAGPGQAAEVAIKIATAHVMSSSQYPEHSTSQPSNLCHIALLAAFSKFVNELS